MKKLSYKIEALCGTALAMALAASPAAAQSTASSAPSASQETTTASPTPQDTATAPDVPDQEIVVTGFKQSLQSALAVKRSAPTVVDAISAEDVGKFPDTNIAEASQRITGVQINRTRGEGRTINIRGLPANFTLITLNGRSVANATVNAESSISRSFDLSLLPSEFIRTLEVYKGSTADLEDGGLSGTVNIRTPRPFDTNKRTFALSAQGVWSSNNGKIAPRVSAFYSDVFADGRLGISLGVSYQRRRTEAQAAVTNYTAATETQGLNGKATDFNADGAIDTATQYRIPAGTLFYIYDEDGKRLSGIGSVQFKATDELTFYADAYYSRLHLQDIRNESLNSFNTATGYVGGTFSTLEGLPTATQFTVTGMDLRGNSRTEQRKGHMDSFDGGLTWKRDDGWSVTLEGGLSKSAQILNNLNLATQARPSATIVNEPGAAIVGVTYINGWDTKISDPTQYNVLSINGEFQRHTKAINNDARFDLVKEFEPGGGLTAIRYGFKYAYDSIYQDNNNLTISAAGVSALYGGLPVGTTAGSYSAAPFMVTVKAQRGSYLDGYSGSTSFPRSFLDSNTLGFISKFTTKQLLAAGTLTNALTGITDVSEKKMGAYLRADFAFGSFTGNIGLRWANTQQQSAGATPDLSKIVLDYTSGNKTTVPTSEQIFVKRSYENWLPSLNLKFDATDKLLFRFGLSRTMARPNLSDIAPNTSVNANSQTITTNNPYLNPFVSDNADLTAEWYFQKGALLGASLLYKNLESLISRQSHSETLTVDVIRDSTGAHPEQITFTVSQLENGSGVHVKGVELYYQQNFTFLPGLLDGFGTQLNFTLLDNSKPTQLTAASKYNLNATLYYQKGPVQARTSYAWRGKYLLTASASPAQGVYRRAFGTLDASLSVALTKYAQIVVEGSNLTDAPEGDEFSTSIPNIYQESGRKITLGGRLRF